MDKVTIRVVKDGQYVGYEVEFTDESGKPVQYGQYSKVCESAKNVELDGLVEKLVAAIKS